MTDRDYTKDRVALLEADNARLARGYHGLKRRVETLEAEAEAYHSLIRNGLIAAAIIYLLRYFDIRIPLGIVIAAYAALVIYAFVKSWREVRAERRERQQDIAEQESLAV